MITDDIKIMMKLKGDKRFESLQQLKSIERSKPLAAHAIEDAFDVEILEVVSSGFDRYRKAVTEEIATLQKNIERDYE